VRSLRSGSHVVLIVVNLFARRYLHPSHFAGTADLNLLRLGLLYFKLNAILVCL